MIDWADFDKRAKELFRSQQSMARPRYWKSGKRKGQVRVPGIELPFDAEDFRRWLAKEIGLSVKLCIYCHAPIDILNCVPDHIEPRARGGSPGLENLQLIDKGCNERKGKFSHDTFLALMEFASHLPAHERDHLMQRLRAAGHGFSKFRKGASKPTPPQDVFYPNPF